MRIARSPRAKDRAARALADVVPRLLNSGTATVACCAPFQTACRKLIPLSSSAFLRFAAHAGAGIRRRRAKRGHAVQAVRPPSTSSTDAGTLYADVICSRVLAAAADSKGVASLMTDHLLAHHARLGLGRRALSSAQGVFIRRSCCTTASQ